MGGTRLAEGASQRSAQQFYTHATDWVSPSRRARHGLRNIFEQNCTSCWRWNEVAIARVTTIPAPFRLPFSNNNTRVETFPWLLTHSRSISPAGGSKRSSNVSRGLRPLCPQKRAGCSRRNRGRPPVFRGAALMLPVRRPRPRRPGRRRPATGREATAHPEVAGKDSVRTASRPSAPTGERAPVGGFPKLL